MQPLYLNDRDIDAVALSSQDILTLVESLFTARHRGQVKVAPRTGLTTSHNVICQLSTASLEQPAIAGVKWVSITPAGLKFSSPHVGGTILLMDGKTGDLVAVLDAKRIVEMRTAAGSAVAAKYLAQPQSQKVGFIGCGRQAISHLHALLALFPLKEVRAFGRGRESATHFIAQAQALGLKVQLENDPERAVTGMDIVISCIPVDSEPFLDMSTLSRGSFVSFVDYAAAWRQSPDNVFDQVIADEPNMVQMQIESGRLKYRGPITSELTPIVAGSHPGRRSKDERIALVPLGVPQGGDLAIGWALYQRAAERGIGTALG